MFLCFVITLTGVLKTGFSKSKEPWNRPPPPRLPFLPPKSSWYHYPCTESYTLDLARGHLIADWIKYCRLQPGQFENPGRGLCLTSEKEN